MRWVCTHAPSPTMRGEEVGCPCPLARPQTQDRGDRDIPTWLMGQGWSASLPPPHTWLPPFTPLYLHLLLQHCRSPLLYHTRLPLRHPQVLPHQPWFPRSSLSSAGFPVLSPPLPSFQDSVSACHVSYPVFVSAHHSWRCQEAQFPSRERVRGLASRSGGSLVVDGWAAGGLRAPMYGRSSELIPTVSQGPGPGLL